MFGSHLNAEREELVSNERQSTKSNLLFYYLVFGDKTTKLLELKLYVTFDMLIDTFCQISQKVGAVFKT